MQATQTGCRQPRLWEGESLGNASPGTGGGQPPGQGPSGTQQCPGFPVPEAHGVRPSWTFSVQPLWLGTEMSLEPRWSLAPSSVDVSAPRTPRCSSRGRRTLCLQRRFPRDPAPPSPVRKVMGLMKPEAPRVWTDLRGRRRCGALCLPQAADRTSLNLPGPPLSTPSTRPAPAGAVGKDQGSLRQLDNHRLQASPSLTRETIEAFPGK